MLKQVGELCNVDKLGRIVIPKKIRRMLDLVDGSCLELLLDDENIVLRRFIPQCAFCGSSDDIIEYKGKCVCKKCLEEINNQNS